MIYPHEGLISNFNKNYAVIMASEFNCASSNCYITSFTLYDK